jgi:hypothetical protein
LATDLRQYEAQPEGTEKLEVRRVPLAEAQRMVIDGEITDALSVLAILRYACCPLPNERVTTEQTEITEQTEV